MTELDLQIAPPASAARGTVPLNNAQLRTRLEDLPALDLPSRLSGLLALVREINAAPAAPSQHRELLNILDRELESLLSLYQQKVRHYAFPLSVQACQLHTEIQALFAETAQSYKRLIMNLLAEPASSARAAALRYATLHCINAIGQQALQAFAIYQDAPNDIWHDLHRLYTYAQRQGFDAASDASQPDIPIRGAYARLLLLAIANPQHLLLGEIYQTDELLRKWALAVRLQAPVPADAVTGHFFCDLAGDQPPAFGVPNISAVPVAEPCLLELDELIAIINKRMKVLALQHQQSLQLRSEWDLLLRLRTAWEKRRVRSEQRQPERGITVKAIVGLSSCHYFFSGYTPFEPEQSEIELHDGDFRQEATLSLLPSDETPWLDADVQNKLKSGVIKPRAYGFDVDNREDDVWKKAHASGQRIDTEMEKNLEQRSLGKIFKFSLVNISAGGVGLETALDSPARLRVGEMIAAFPHGDSGDGDPVLNVVRWMHCDHARRLYIGLRHIDGEPVPVALRSLDKDAHYQNYARGFSLVDDAGRQSVIVPAGLFNNGNMLLVNHGDRMEVVQLKTLVQNTRAFGQFTCETVQADEILSEHIIHSLKKLLSQDLH
ncbi:MAG: hypothetical protein RQ736_00760 [Thiogranum sp.]|nr:hypothetical protein [Thiogranum sp.]